MPATGFHFKTTVELGTGLTADVSTINLALTGGHGMETCIFFCREGKGFTSEVVATYGSREEAEIGHEGFCHPAVLRYVLSAIEDRKFLAER